MSDTLEESLPAHAPLGPSSAEGWSTCSDYVNANRGLPDTTTEPAAEGTAAHAISDICLSLGLDADDFLGMVTEVHDWEACSACKSPGYSGLPGGGCSDCFGEGRIPRRTFLFAWEEDDAMLLQRGIDQLRSAADMNSFYGEQRVDISAWTLPGQFGTLDRAYIHHDVASGEWWVVIADLKWGRGVAVSPVENKQLVLYALGFWHAIARHKIPTGVQPRFRLIIDQPRHGGGGGVWETTLADLLERGAWLKERAALTAAPNPTRTASLKGCMWCRRRRVAPKGLYGGCDTFDEYMLGLLGLTWSDVDLGLMMETGMTLPTEMTPERASFVLLHKDAIERWLKELYERVHADALSGAATGEVKVVEGNKSPDTWKDKGATVRPIARQLLGDKAFTLKLNTPKQMLRAAEGDEAILSALSEHTKEGRKKPILVPLADARPAIVAAQGLLDEEADDGD